MKKVEAVAQFRQMWKEAVAWNPRLKNDTVARRCEFNDYVDYLQKDGHITEYQAYNWSNPFKEMYGTVVLVSHSSTHTSFNPL